MGLAKQSLRRPAKPITTRHEEWAKAHSSCPPLPSVRASPDLLVLPLRLPGVGVVERLALGLGVHPLVRRARAGVDVPAGDRVRRVAVDRVLQAQSRGERTLLGVGFLDPDLRCAEATAAEVAGGVAANGLVLLLLLGRVSVVVRLRLGLRVGPLIRRART